MSIGLTVLLRVFLRFYYPQWSTAEILRNCGILCKMRYCGNFDQLNFHVRFLLAVIRLEIYRGIKYLMREIENCIHTKKVDSSSLAFGLRLFSKDFLITKLSDFLSIS